MGTATAGTPIPPVDNGAAVQPVVPTAPARDHVSGTPENTDAVEFGPSVDVPTALPPDPAPSTATDTEPEPTPVVPPPSPGAQDDEPLPLGDDEIPPLVPQPPSTDQVIQQLQREIEQLKAERAQPAPPVQPVAAPAAQVEPEDYIDSDEAFDEITADRKGFNKFLHEFREKVHTAAKSEAVREAAELVLPQAAQMALHIASNMLSVYSSMQDLFDTHKDLKPHQEYVGKVYQALQSKYPDWTHQQLLGAAAKVAKRAIAKAQPVVPGNGGSPLAPGTAARSAVPQLQPSGVDEFRDIKL